MDFEPIHEACKFSPEGGVAHVEVMGPMTKHQHAWPLVLGAAPRPLGNVGSVPLVAMVCVVLLEVGDHFACALGHPLARPICRRVPDHKHREGKACALKSRCQSLAGGGGIQARERLPCVPALGTGYHWEQVGRWAQPLQRGVGTESGSELTVGGVHQDPPASGLLHAVGSCWGERALHCEVVDCHYLSVKRSHREGAVVTQDILMDQQHFVHPGVLQRGAKRGRLGTHKVGGDGLPYSCRTEVPQPKVLGGADCLLRAHLHFELTAPSGHGGEREAERREGEVM